MSPDPVLPLVFSTRAIRIAGRTPPVEQSICALLPGDGRDGAADIERAPVQPR